MFRQHYEKMYNLARSILSDDDESKDVVGEVFTTILADDVVLMPESEEGFLMRSVRNRCLNLIAHKSVKERVTDCYTDEQVERLLADEDVKDFFHDMAMVRMAMKKGNPKKVNVDEAWKKFADKQGLKANEASDKTSSNHWKIAASIIGVVFLSGITFAAIHSGIFRFSSSDEANQAKTEQVSSTSDLNRMDSIKVSATEKADSLDLKPVVFDNTELGDVVSQLAAFYHVKVEFGKAESQHIRIFFNWDKTKTLKQNLEILNAFERIQITEVDGILRVE